MGIKFLAPSLRPFASQEQLQGRLVIDGPSLAYHILRLARHKAEASSILDLPSYSVLGATTTRWLDGLQARGLNV